MSGLGLFSPGLPALGVAEGANGFVDSGVFIDPGAFRCVVTIRWLWVKLLGGVEGVSEILVLPAVSLEARK